MSIYTKGTIGQFVKAVAMTGRDFYKESGKIAVTITVPWVGGIEIEYHNTFRSDMILLGPNEVNITPEEFWAEYERTQDCNKKLIQSFGI